MAPSNSCTMYAPLGHLATTAYGPLVTIGSPIVQMNPQVADLGSAYKLAPQSPGLPQTERLSIGVLKSILKLREVGSLSMRTIYSFPKRSSDQTYVNKHQQTSTNMEKVGEKSPDLSHDRLPNLVSRIVTGTHLHHLDPLAKTSRGGSSPMSPPAWKCCPRVLQGLRRHLLRRGLHPPPPLQSVGPCHRAPPRCQTP